MEDIKNCSHFYKMREDQGFLRLHLASLKYDFDDANCSHETFILTVFSLLVSYYSLYNLTAWNSESQSIYVKLENTYTEVSRFLVLTIRRRSELSKVRIYFTVKMFCKLWWESLEALQLFFTFLLRAVPCCILEATRR